MKKSLSIALLTLCASITIHAQTVIRQQFEDMPNAKIASIPDFVLPTTYNDRTAHPLPAVVNHETDTGAKLYMPPFAWSIDGWSCANASAVSYSFDYAVQTFMKIVSSGNSPLYTYNYTYHFLDNANQATGGDGWMYIEAFDILKATGCPTSTDFGGFDGAIDQTNVWMSGYDKYYKAMHVRVDQYYKIDPNAAGADDMIRQIVYDYADGSPYGAILTFQANSEQMPTTTVNGRRTFTSLGGGGGHALTICGYDINHQGGSWLIQSGWGDGDYWCPFTLLRSGTPWYNNPVNNKYVMFCRIKKNYAPKFAFKVNLTHNQRNKICIMTGVASTSSATAPTSTMDYAGAFNFDGGSVPMCGSGQSSTIEIGLDLTDFSSVVSSGQGTFFLTVISKGGTGQVNSLALEDYNGASVREIPCSRTNIGISGTITMAVPWTGAVASEIDQRKITASHQGNDLVASQISGSNLVRFTFPGSKTGSAVLQIRDIGGRTILTKTIPAGVTENPSTALWNIKDYLGRPVSAGAYIASVNTIGVDGAARHLMTKVLVR
jgi:hypothetical protein